MPRVVALYRYPLKSFTPEECETLTVLNEGRIAGDRVLGIRFADTKAADDAWSKKAGMLALVNTPGMARLHLRFEEKTLRLRISLASVVLVDEILNNEGRKRVAAAVADYVLKHEEISLTGHPERLPLRVVGDGITPRYHDNEAGQVTLHSRESLADLAAAVGDAQLSERRFRSNIAMVTMPRVVALYRYPLKSFTPEECETLTVLNEGRIAGDRVLGIRFADTKAADDAWSKKAGMLALVNTPGMARLHLRFEEKTLRLRISLASVVLVDEILNNEGRKRVAAAVADYVLKHEEISLTGHPERLPLRVVGDGITPRYHDNEAGQVTLHSRESLADLAAAVGDAQLSERRFRSNIAIEGLRAWEEQAWIGKKVQIGAVEFGVVKSKMRCLATHANPKTGERDQPILTTLTRVLGQEIPTFAVAMLPIRAGGEIHVGDEVNLAD